MKNKNAFLVFLCIGAISMIIMSAHYFTETNSGILGGKAIKDAIWYKFVFLSHVLTGIIAISTGPFQFISTLLAKKSKLHRKLGYLYFFAVLIASSTGLVIAQFAMGGIITQVGFSILAIIWLSSLILAISSIKNGQVQAHKNWMMINYAITFSAITQRTILLFAFLPYFSFMPVYQVSSWLSWMINISIVLFVISKERQRQFAL